jgi:hypothetical protein
MTSAAKGLAAVVCGAAAAALLTACKPGAQEAAAQDAPPPLAALPLTQAAAPQAQPGPVAVDLPYAQPARIGPVLMHDDGYAYLDRAYFLNDALAEAPPDYAFYYDDEAPWVWETDDGFFRVVEVLPYGDRYYYFEPGQDYPFLIRDPDYAYAYAEGDLIGIYDSDGALLPPEDLMLHAPIAGRELARAQTMFRQAVGQRQPVALAAWTQRRGQIGSELAGWRKLEDHQTGWRNYHQAHAKAEQAHWAPERFRREAESARVAQTVHDPDAAQHAWREARRAQDIARKDHVRIALQPHGRPTPVIATAPVAPSGPTVRAETVLARRNDLSRSTGQAALDRARPERAAAARAAEPQAQYNLRAHQQRAFERPAGPHARAAQELRAPRQEQHAAAERGSSRPAQTHEAQAPHLHIVMAQQNGGSHGGGHGGGDGGGNPGGGGGHQAPPENHGAGGEGHGRGH